MLQSYNVTTLPVNFTHGHASFISDPKPTNICYQLQQTGTFPGEGVHCIIHMMSLLSGFSFFPPVSCPFRHISIFRPCNVQPGLAKQCTFHTLIRITFYCLQWPFTTNTLWMFSMHSCPWMLSWGCCICKCINFNPQHYHVRFMLTLQQEASEVPLVKSILKSLFRLLKDGTCSPDAAGCHGNMELSLGLVWLSLYGEWQAALVFRCCRERGSGKRLRLAGVFKHIQLVPVFISRSIFMLYENEQVKYRAPSLHQTQQ